MKKDKFERNIYVTPPFDKRHSNPSKNYGIGSIQIRWVIKGEKGAVQFLMSTGTYLPSSFDEKGSIFNAGRPSAWDIGYHSPTPMFEGQTLVSDNCEFIEGPCYYDGSGLQAEEPMNVFLEKGSEALWKYLIEYYNSQFE